MLPKQVIDLIDGFVTGFDLEYPAVFEFRKARTKAAESVVKSGIGWGSGAVGLISRDITAYLERKSQFVWDKLQQIITSIGIESYPELSGDLKSQVVSYLNPTRQAAERYLEEIRQATSAPSGYTMQIKAGFDMILPRVNAEVDLFCVKFAMNEKRKNSPPTSSYHFTNINVQTNYGQVGEVLNNCTNIINQQQDGAAKRLLGKLQTDVTALIEALPADKAGEAADNLRLLVDAATAEKPKRKWYSVSADGLLEASKFAKGFAGNIAGTIGQLGKLLWPDFNDN